MRRPQQLPTSIIVTCNDEYPDRILNHQTILLPQLGLDFKGDLKKGIIQQIYKQDVEAISSRRI
jgi:hypothetical protein